MVAVPLVILCCAWKGDLLAVLLQAELVRIAVEMEASMLAKLGPSGSTSPRMMSPADRQVGMSARSPLLQPGREVWLARMKKDIPLWHSSSTILDHGGCAAFGGSACPDYMYGALCESVSLVQAVVEQVARDHALLRERIQRLGGQAGITRLEASLAAARANAAAQPPPPGSPLSSPGAPLHLARPQLTTRRTCSAKRNSVQG